MCVARLCIIIVRTCVRDSTKSIADVWRYARSGKTKRIFDPDHDQVTLSDNDGDNTLLNVATDDDNASVLDIEIEADGTYVIIATRTDLEAGNTSGDYRLTITCAE